MNIRVFDQGAVREAMVWASVHPANVAVHLHRFVGPNAPACFKRAVDHGGQIAHVFCQDAVLLAKLAKTIGIRGCWVERIGEAGQHIDACGKPLERLRAMADA